MRIAAFHNLSSGGAKRSALDSIRRLSSRHHVDVFCLASADHDFADLRPFVNRYRTFDFAPLPLLSSPFGRINNLSRIVDLARLAKVSRQVARTIERSNYDVVLVHPCRYENSPSMLSALERTPAVFYCHEPLRIVYEAPPSRPYEARNGFMKTVFDRVDPFPALFRKTLQRRDRRNLLRADRVLVNSKFSRDSLRRAYGAQSEVSYHGVDAAHFSPSLELARERVALSVGSLTPLKGFDFLIQAVACIRPAKRPPLQIVSNFQNPPERQHLRELANRLGVELQFHTNVDEQSLVDFYRRASVFAYSPIREPFGLVPLEAMACGVPVVAVREGGVPESVKDGQTGFLVERSPEAFADAVERLLDDPVLAAEMGRRGRALVEANWTWDRAAERLEGFLADAACSCKRSSLKTSRETRNAKITERKALGEKPRNNEPRSANG